MTNTISSVVSDQSVEQLGDVTSLANQWSLDGIFDDFIANNGEINLGNIDLNLFADQTEVINDVLDQALGGLCQ